MSRAVKSDEEQEEESALARIESACPFCKAPASGGALEFERTRTMSDNIFIRCTNCGAGGPNWANACDHAVTLWEGRI